MSQGHQTNGIRALETVLQGLIEFHGYVHNEFKLGNLQTEIAHYARASSILLVDLSFLMQLGWAALAEVMTLGVS